MRGVAGFLKMIKTTFDRCITLKTMKKVWSASLTFNIPIIPKQTYFMNFGKQYIYQ